MKLGALAARVTLLALCAAASFRGPGSGSGLRAAGRGRARDGARARSVDSHHGLRRDRARPLQERRRRSDLAPTGAGLRQAFPAGPGGGSTRDLEPLRDDRHRRRLPQHRRRRALDRGERRASPPVTSAPSPSIRTIAGSVYAGAEAGTRLPQRPTPERRGRSWRLRPRASASRCVAVDPVTPGLLYVGTNSEGVFWSTDAGTELVAPERAHEPRNGLEPDVRSNARRRCSPAPTTASSAAPTAGATWLPPTRGLRSWNVLSHRRWTPRRPETHVCRHGGRDLQVRRPRDDPGPSCKSEPLRHRPSPSIPRSPSTLYAATHLGVIKSDDAGTQWKRPPHGPPGRGRGIRRIRPRSIGIRRRRAAAAASAAPPPLPVRARTARRPAALPPLPVRTSPPGP